MECGASDVWVSRAFCYFPTRNYEHLIHARLGGWVRGDRGKTHETDQVVKKPAPTDAAIKRNNINPVTNFSSNYFCDSNFSFKSLGMERWKRFLKEALQTSGEG